MSVYLVVCQVEFQMAGGTVLAFVDAEHMTVEDSGLLVPMISHVVRMDGKPGALQAAVRAEEPGDIARQLGIDSPAGEAQLAFRELRIALRPKLQGLRADLGSIGQDGAVAELDLDMATQGIAGVIFVVTAVVSRDDGPVLSLDYLVCDTQCYGLRCRLGRQRPRQRQESGESCCEQPACWFHRRIPPVRDSCFLILYVKATFFAKCAAADTSAFLANRRKK